MARLLLDTCDFLWFISDDPRLPAFRRQAIKDESNLVYLSSVCVAEIAIKHSLGKLALPSHPADYVQTARTRHGILPIPFTEASALLLAELPLIHKDPFDRMLICHAIAHDMTFVTSDPKNHLYAVSRI